MPSVSVEIDPGDVAAFERALKRAMSQMKKDVPETLRFVARGLTHRMITSTPKAKPTTIWMWQNKKKLIRRRVDRRPTPRRGLARAGFSAAAASLKVPRDPNNIRKRYGYIRDNSRSLRDAKIEIGNEVPYIGALDRGGQLPPYPPNPKTHSRKAAHILSRGFQVAAKKLEENLDKVAARQGHVFGA